MTSAKTVVVVALSALAIALVAVFLVLEGMESFRLVVFIAVLCGAIAVALGIVGVITGEIKDDLRE